MRTIRSFLAIKLDIDTVRAISETQQRLSTACSESGMKISWVPPPNMHITIRFLGNITEPMIHALKDMLKPTVFKFKAFELEAKGLGAFPDVEKPRIVWAGIEDGTGILSQLHGAVSERLVSAGFQIDDKPFKSHVTLGRIKGGQTDDLASCLAEEMSESWGTTIVKNIYCYRSDLNPKGAEYHILWRLPLANVRRTDQRYITSEPPKKEESEGRENS